ncbi:MAG: Glutamine cyclotransferase [Candidatus Atribacteria bacterium ADurb.Bin276]|uniref:Glutamine cyclotransferase n=1 Tax=Candidatus Atribacter allofermentans TaxID=1852833 RepID=A0A1V5SLN4_9BACT|nr:MAG: Glutamine cyclotransferase [Candidatus Atribacteria bacterium ADurb.Bin276]
MKKHLLFVLEPISILFLVFFLLFFSISAQSMVQNQEWLFNHLSKNQNLTKYTYQVVALYPHDSRAFTQGLIFHEGFLYESTGLYGESSLRKIDLRTGKVLLENKIDEIHFAEGLTLFNNLLIQLTWKSHLGFLYEVDTFEYIGSFEFPYEGWGITHDNQNLIISDGSDTLHFLDPKNFLVTKEIQVHLNGLMINQLNELEFINGKIYSNVWHTNLILIINPDDGEVIGWINLTGLEKQSDLSKNVLNGIAFDQTNNHLFITGKNWPHLYEILLIEER